MAQETKPKRGGARPYRVGAERERRVKRVLEQDGYHVIRQPKSGSPYDLLCVATEDMCRKGRSRVNMIQVKSRGYLRPAEKEALIELATRFDAVPELAWIEGKVVKRRNLNGGDTSELAC